MSGYQQAVIRIEHEKEYQELKGAIQRAVGPERMKQFLKRVESSGLPEVGLGSIDVSGSGVVGFPELTRVSVRIGSAVAHDK